MNINDAKDYIFEYGKKAIMDAKQKIEGCDKIKELYLMMIDCNETSAAECFLNMAKLYFMVNPNANELDFLQDVNKRFNNN